LTTAIEVAEIFQTTMVLDSTCGTRSSLPSHSEIWLDFSWIPLAEHCCHFSINEEICWNEGFVNEQGRLLLLDDGEKLGISVISGSVKEIRWQLRRGKQPGYGREQRVHGLQ
jgi:hypothetical protein